MSILKDPVASEQLGRFDQERFANAVPVVALREPHPLAQQGAKADPLSESMKEHRSESGVKPGVTANSLSEAESEVIEKVGAGNGI